MLKMQVIKTFLALMRGYSVEVGEIDLKSLIESSLWSANHLVLLCLEETLNKLLLIASIEYI